MTVGVSAAAVFAVTPASAGNDYSWKGHQDSCGCDGWMAQGAEKTPTGAIGSQTQVELLAAGAKYVRPVTGRITSPFGPRWGRFHYGVDIAARIGTPVYAVTDGVVLRSGPARGFGLWVMLRHADGTRSVYGHINRSFVRVGERVSAGKKIAEVGARRNATGPSLHFEIRQRNGARVDPLRWLRRHGVNI